MDTLTLGLFAILFLTASQCTIVYTLHRLQKELDLQRKLFAITGDQIDKIATWRESVEERLK